MASSVGFSFFNLLEGSFIFSLVIMVILAILLVYYFRQCILQMEHKISSMFELVKILTTEVNTLKNSMIAPTNLGGGIGLTDISSSSSSSVSHQSASAATATATATAGEEIMIRKINSQGNMEMMKEVDLSIDEDFDDEGIHHILKKPSTTTKKQQQKNSLKAPSFASNYQLFGMIDPYLPKIVVSDDEITEDEDEDDDCDDDFVDEEEDDNDENEEPIRENKIYRQYSFDSYNENTNTNVDECGTLNIIDLGDGNLTSTTTMFGKDKENNLFLISTHISSAGLMARQNTFEVIDDVTIVKKMEVEGGEADGEVEVGKAEEIMTENVGVEPEISLVDESSIEFVPSSTTTATITNGKMSVQDLRQLALSRGIVDAHKMKKGELLKLLGL